MGTGSILIAASHLRALTIGADIDIRVIREGKIGSDGQVSPSLLEFPNLIPSPPEQYFTMIPVLRYWTRDRTFDKALKLCIYLKSNLKESSKTASTCIDSLCTFFRKDIWSNLSFDRFDDKKFAYQVWIEGSPPTIQFQAPLLLGISAGICLKTKSYKALISPI